MLCSNDKLRKVRLEGHYKGENKVIIRFRFCQKHGKKQENGNGEERVLSVKLLHASVCLRSSQQKLAIIRFTIAVKKVYRLSCCISAPRIIATKTCDNQVY